MDGIPDNLRRVQDRMAQAARRSGRSPAEVRLVAISKTFPPEAILEAVRAGQRCFGENRIQEAEPKIEALRGAAGLEWHLVGHLQSNKARRAAELFDVVHSLDSAKLAARLSQAALERGKRISALIQVDLGHEPTKFGAETAELAAILQAAAGLAGIRIDGLMTLPPFFDSPEEARPYFSALRRQLDSLEAQSPGCLGARYLSMGMSHDYEIAIEEGATHVRVGTGIFGSRPHA